MARAIRSTAKPIPATSRLNSRSRPPQLQRPRSGFNTHLPSRSIGYRLYERRTGLPSKKRQNWEEYANQRLLAAKEQGELEREAQEVEASIIVLDTDLKAAKAERDRQPVYPSAKEIEEGKLPLWQATNNLNKTG